MKTDVTLPWLLMQDVHHIPHFFFGAREAEMLENVAARGLRKGRRTMFLLTLLKMFVH